MDNMAKLFARKLDKVRGTDYKFIISNSLEERDLSPEQIMPHVDVFINFLNFGYDSPLYRSAKKYLEVVKPYLSKQQLKKIDMVLSPKLQNIHNYGDHSKDYQNNLSLTKHFGKGKSAFVKKVRTTKNKKIKNS